jgi:hypothetical protein
MDSKLKPHRARPIFKTLLAPSILFLFKTSRAAALAFLVRLHC